ncbi:MAG: hypothetical protein AAGJ31_01925 [Verrucomicrobiota bacterium]
MRALLTAFLILCFCPLFLTSVEAGRRHKCKNVYRTGYSARHYPVYRVYNRRPVLTAARVATAASIRYHARPRYYGRTVRISRRLHY